MIVVVMWRPRVKLAGRVRIAWRPRVKLAGWVRIAFLLFFGVGSVLAYVALAMTVDGQPPSQPFPGAVAVLQPASQPGGDQVELEVDSSLTGNQPQPELLYFVGVCGPDPYRGELVMAGAARLAHAQAAVITSHPTGFVTTPVIHGGDVEAVSPVIGSLTFITNPQVVSFSFAKPGPCPFQPLFGRVLNSQYLLVGGRTGVPVDQSWTSPFGWWHGPQVSMAWPLTGTLSWDAVGYNAVTWDFYVRGHLTTFVTPADESVQVVPRVSGTHAEGVPLSWSIDAAEPATDVPASAFSAADPGLGQPVGWSSTGPLAATARFTDRGSLAAWQNYLVTAGVGMGIGGAMLASIAFELLKPNKLRLTEHDSRNVADSHLEDIVASRPIPEAETSRQKTLTADTDTS